MVTAVNLAAEILELTGNAARDTKMRRVIPCHLRLGIRNDAIVFERNFMIKKIGPASHHVIVLTECGES